METNNINLEEISKIPDTKFKKHFHEWLESDGVARSLQAKLRKDLIDAFNKTNLGRKLFSQHQKTSRIMLSPLILALNTLVAEFLYAQNCHFSLSVFSTEVPYRNTLPDFENNALFRFSQTELFEIFEAISGDVQPDVKDTIMEQYLQDSVQNGPSLLYLIFKYIFKKYEEPEQITNEPVEQNFEEIKKSESISENKEKKVRKDSQHAAYSHHFRYLNKYLVILSRKVKEMAYSLEQLQRRGGDEKSVRRKSLKDRKLESLNRSLEKISDGLRNLSISKRKNKNISTILSAVDKLSQQFEKCASNFESVSMKLIKEKSEKVEPKTEKSYSEWITDLKTTKNGKKFIARVESSLRKTLEREKRKMQQAFDDQQQNQKELIKLKCKQKVLEQLGKHSTKEEDDNSKKANELIEEKLKELDKKHQELLKRVTEGEERVKTPPNFLNLQKELVSVRDGEEDGENCKKASALPFEIKNNGRRRDELLKPEKSNFIENFKPQLEEMAKTISQHERNIDHIVFDAKLRVQELEHESNQLERSFQEYLQRQKGKKNQMEESLNSVWEKYNLEKTALNKKCVAIRSARNHENVRSKSELKLDNLIPGVPQINVVTDKNASKKLQELPAFENPFRRLKEEMLLKEHWTNVKLSGSSNKDLSKAPPVSKGEIFKISQLGEHNLNRKNEVFRHIYQRSANVHVITHEDKDIDNHPEAILTSTSKNDDPGKVVNEESGVSSDMNLKDISLDAVDISPSRSPSIKSEHDTTKNTFKCKRSLFTKNDNFKLIESEKAKQPTTDERSDDVSKSIEKKSLETNIFQQSSFFKSSNESNKINERQGFEVSINPSEFNLDLPAHSSKNLSSSNSTSPSFKLNLSVGRGDISGDEFWS